MKFGTPIAIQGPAPAALVNFGQRAFGATQTVTYTINNIDQAYASFLVIVNFVTGGQLWAASIRGGSPLPLNALWIYKGAFPSNSGTAGSGQVILGSSNNAGDQVVIQAYFGAISTGNITVYGLPNYVPEFIRPDGYNYPIGAFAQSADTAASGTLIAAPGPGFRILLRTLIASMNVVSAGAVQSSVIVAGGNIQPLVGTASSSYANEWPKGLLLDNNTAFTYTLSGSGTYLRCFADYDIVSTNG